MSTSINTKSTNRQICVPLLCGTAGTTTRRRENPPITHDSPTQHTDCSLPPTTINCTMMCNNYLFCRSIIYLTVFEFMNCLKSTCKLCIKLEVPLYFCVDSSDIHILCMMFFSFVFRWYYTLSFFSVSYSRKLFHLWAGGNS